MSPPIVQMLEMQFVPSFVIIFTEATIIYMYVYKSKQVNIITFGTLQFIFLK